MKRVRLLLLLVLLLASWPQPGLAQAAVRLQVRVGFDGQCKDGALLPVQVTLTNNGPDVLGQVEVVAPSYNPSDDRYQQEVALPAGGVQTVWLYPPSENNVGKVEARLLVAAQVIAKQEVEFSCLGQSDLLVGSLAAQPSALSPLSAALGARLAVLSPEDLPPHAPAWSGLDLLALVGSDSGAIPLAQRAALGDWVRGGGTLLVVGGPDWQRTTAGLADLLPVTDLQPVDLDPDGLRAALRDFSGDPSELAATAPVVVSGRPRPHAQVLLAAAEQPLIVRRALGYGQVIYLALDPTASPLRAWPGLTDFFRASLRLPLPRPAWGGGFQAWNDAETALGMLGGAGAAVVSSLTCFLGLYILLVGPLNYLVLRRLKRLELAWITIPALVLVFSLLTFLVGDLSRGARPILHRLAIVQTWPDDGRARVDGLIGVFAPRRGVFDLTVAGDLTARGLSSANFGGATRALTLVAAGDRVTLPELRIDSANLRAVAISGWLAAAQAPAVTGDLRYASGSGGLRLTGELRNPGDLPLQDVAVLFPGGGQNLGDLAPGATLPVDLLLPSGGRAQPRTALFGPALANAGKFAPMPDPGWMEAIVNGSDFYSNTPNRRRYTLINAATNYALSGQGFGSGVFVSAWSATSPLDARLDRPTQTEDLTLLLAAMTVGYPPTTGAVTLPPALFAWTSSGLGDGPTVGPYDGYTNRDGVVFSYRPLFSLTWETIDALTLHLQNYGSRGPANVRLSLWDFSAGAWEELPDPVWGDQTIPTPRRFVAPDGEVRLQLTALTDDSVSFERADFSLTYTGSVGQP